MKKAELAAAVVKLLEKEYPAADCSLEYDNPWQLLFATRLAAQCTDARVNMITPALYKKYPTLEAMAAADITELEEMVHSCGFYHHKARDLKNGAAVLLERFGGRVPDTMEELLSVPGVGRKTANLVLGDVFGKPGIVADTHCIRLSNLIGLCNTKDPYKVELALSKLIAPKEQSMYCHRCVWHGREVCIARRPQCGRCVLKELCKSSQAKTEPVQP